MSQRKVVWFSCGAASAVAAKLAVEKYGKSCEIAYCDTSINEHPDNERFFREIESWLGQKIIRLQNKKYRTIYDVFDQTRYLVGVHGAKCTTELKKKVRREYVDLLVLNIFGFTYEEATKKTQSGLTRVELFERNNPEVLVEWILVDNHITKTNCYHILQKERIDLPTMYKLGYRNNNCIGCVKGGQGYWNKIRIDFPQVFDRMARQERKMNVAINKRYEGKKRIRLFLDELLPDAGHYPSEPDISCGVTCVGLHG